MREIILYFVLKYKGDWEQVYKAISEKEIVDTKELEGINESINSNYVSIIDSQYPEAFKNSIRPPFVLFYHGNWDLVHNMKNLAVIGTREPSEYGLKACEKLISEAGNDVVVISGMAKGIDAKAHQSAINSRKKTIAVLGSGINYVYPSENKKLYEELKANHLVISEYPDKMEPEGDNFKWRNRLVATLSKAILVVEAKRKSGTMNTVMWGLKMGKEILAVPSSIFVESGTNYLIDQGATLVQNGNDIAKEM